MSRYEKVAWAWAAVYAMWALAIIALGVFAIRRGDWQGLLLAFMLAKSAKIETKARAAGDAWKRDIIAADDSARGKPE